MNNAPLAVSHAFTLGIFLEKFGMSLLAVSILVGVGARSFYVFWSKCKSLSKEIKDLLRDLEADLASTRKVDLWALEKISERMGKSPVFSHYWSVFEATLIVDDTNIYNTRPVSEFISFEELMDKQVGAKSFAKQPALMTSMGLSFTFTFIVIGLSHLKPLDSGKIEGISQLIEGLSAKFISSITALLLSILLTVADDIMTRELEDSYHKLVDLLDRKFQKQTAEDYLRSLERSMRELNTVMKASEPKGAGTTLEAGSELKELGTIIQKLSVVMSENAGRAGETSGELEKLIAALGEQAQVLQKEQATGIEEGLVPLLERVQENTKLQADSVARMLEIMEKMEHLMLPSGGGPRKRLSTHLKESRRFGT